MKYFFCGKFGSVESEDWLMCKQGVSDGQHEGFMIVECFIFHLP